MQKQHFVILARIAIIFVFLIGICICCWWYPLSFSLFTVGVVSGESAASIDITPAQNTAFWVQLIFSWITSLPCFAVLCLCYKSTCHAKKEDFFSLPNSKLYKWSGLLLLIDSVIFITGHVVFMFLKWNPFVIIYFVLGFLGLIFALVSYAFYGYLLKAVQLKEENDSIL
jgi:hypothetical protein